VFNHITHFDKLAVYHTLNQSPLSQYLPATKPYDPNTFQHFLNKHKRLILKPKNGRLGSKIHFIEQNIGHFNIYFKTKYPVFSFSQYNLLLSKIKSLVDSDFLMQQYIPCARAN